MEPILLAIPGGASIALIAVAILLLFGGKKIPELKALPLKEGTILAKI